MPSRTATPEHGPAASRRPQRRALLVALSLFALLLALPAPAGMPPEAWRTTALVVLMGALWLGEPIPIPATALAPLALGPLLGLGGIEALAAPYASSLVFLLLGGFAIGLAMERCGLHRRLALAVVAGCGARADRVVGGVMLATAVMSMWISNTATAAMMVPIGLSVIALIDAGRGEGHLSPPPLTVPMLLGVAFAANIGGIATLIGTPPNAVLAAYLGRVHGLDIGFAEWMALGVPVAALLLAGCWLILTRLTTPLSGARIEGVAALVARERARLGAMSGAEWRFASVFILTGLGWLLRPAIDRALPGMAVSDAGIAMLATLALFMLPGDPTRGGPLLDWSATRELPWGVLILVGGGLSLGAAIQSSGLGDWVGFMLSGLRDWPLPLTVATVALATMAVSHVASNTATAAALTPVAAALAVSIGTSPTVLGVAVALSASCAFMLPVATPPNAIAYGTGLVTTAQMVRAGGLLGALSLATVVAAGVLLAGTGFGGG